jgi:hypothetical protein
MKAFLNSRWIESQSQILYFNLNRNRFIDLFIKFILSFLLKNQTEYS